VSNDQEEASGAARELDGPNHIRRLGFAANERADVDNGHG